MKERPPAVSRIRDAANIPYRFDWICIEYCIELPPVQRTLGRIEGNLFNLILPSSSESMASLPPDEALRAISWLAQQNNSELLPSIVSIANSLMVPKAEEIREVSAADFSAFTMPRRMCSMYTSPPTIDTHMCLNNIQPLIAHSLDALLLQDKAVVPGKVVAPLSEPPSKPQPAAPKASKKKPQAPPAESEIMSESDEDLPPTRTCMTVSCVFTFSLFALTA
jgi:hypothetical protein